MASNPQRLNGVKARQWLERPVARTWRALSQRTPKTLSQSARVDELTRVLKNEGEVPAPGRTLDQWEYDRPALALQTLAGLDNVKARNAVLDWARDHIHHPGWTVPCSIALARTKDERAVPILAKVANKNFSMRFGRMLPTYDAQELVKALLGFRTRAAYEAVFDGMKMGEPLRLRQDAIDYALANQPPHSLHPDILPALATRLGLIATPREVMTRQKWIDFLDVAHFDFIHDKRWKDHPHVVALDRFWRHVQRDEGGAINENLDFTVRLAAEAFRRADNPKMRNALAISLYIRQLRNAYLARQTK